MPEAARNSSSYLKPWYWKKKVVILLVHFPTPSCHGLLFSFLAQEEKRKETPRLGICAFRPNEIISIDKHSNHFHLCSHGCRYIDLNLPLRFLYLNFSRLINDPQEGEKPSSGLLSRTDKKLRQEPNLVRDKQQTRQSISQ